LKLESTRHFGHCLAYCTCPRWLWWWKPKYSENTRPSVTLSTTNPTWAHPGSKPGYRGGKPATKHLSYGAAKIWSSCMMKNIKITAFLNEKPFSLLDSHQHFGWSCYLRHVGKKRGWVFSLEDSVRFHWYIGVSLPLYTESHPRKL
jgi:hypothetical protein